MDEEDVEKGERGADKGHYEAREIEDGNRAGATKTGLGELGLDRLVFQELGEVQLLRDIGDAPGGVTPDALVFKPGAALLAQLFAPRGHRLQPRFKLVALQGRQRDGQDGHEHGHTRQQRGQRCRIDPL